MARYARLAAFMIVVLGAGFAIGTTNLPGAWYAGLHKPPFNPPDWVFAPVWSVVYGLIAIAGWRTCERAPRSAAMALWSAQMVLNFTWSPIFFTAHRTGLALAIIIAMFVAIMSFIASQWHVDRVAAWLFVPYAVWVAFATLLNASIFALN
ncbi:TspO/MBR family protein [Bradyrhizobium sp. McL0616]|uniref:TspO/MBR family protein n=1 Tax=Bradyrhizobium sp. McL0616 TaxID=3415674 RepID=UPI003CF46DFE